MHQPGVDLHVWHDAPGPRVECPGLTVVRICAINCPSLERRDGAIETMHQPRVDLPVRHYTASARVKGVGLLIITVRPQYRPALKWSDCRFARDWHCPNKGLGTSVVHLEAARTRIPLPTAGTKAAASDNISVDLGIVVKSCITLH